MENLEIKTKDGSFFPIEDVTNTENDEKKINNHFFIDEEIFIKQKEEILKTKRKNNNQENRLSNKDTSSFSNIDLNILNQDNIEKNDINEKEINNEINNYLTLNDYNYFESTEFFCDISGDEQDSFPILDTTWTNEKQLKLYGNKIKFIELRNLALRTVNEVNYKNNGIQIKINFNLKGESQLWIFSRCFINNDLDENDSNNEYNKNINSGIFNKYTSLIKISKEVNSNKCYIHFSTFYEDNNNGKIYLKTFYKRQLIEFKVKDNISNHYYYNENDICEFNLNLLDLGNEEIKTKISVNGSKRTNDTKGNFYIPINKKAKILICGVGESVNIKNLTINSFNKEEDFILNNGFFSIEQKNCDCCYIF